MKNPAFEHINSRKVYVRESYEKIAGVREKWISRNGYFYALLGQFLKYVIEPGKSVLLLKSEAGQLLDAIGPPVGVGVEACRRMASSAAKKYPKFSFICADYEDVSLRRTFDYVVFYTLGDIIDIERALLNAANLATERTRFVIVNYNYLWRPLVYLAEKTGLKAPQPTQNWLNAGIIENLLYISGYEVVKSYRQILFPFYVPVLSWLLNGVAAKLPLIRGLCFLQILVARKTPDGVPGHGRAGRSVSVIVPCKNERGNIEGAVERIPEMGGGTEIIFCDDKSTDGTADEVRRVIRDYPARKIRLVDGPGICKAKNVWAGFDAATGDVLMILDADLTVMPEELPYFYNALVEGRGEFINGTRMVYPMQKEAMRTLNIIGNKFFSVTFSYLLGQTLTDTLCGTKVFWRKDWPRLKALVGSWGIDDRWGDYELIFGAAKLHLKTIEVPVHYLERVYGETKMTKRLTNGLIMLRMCFAAFRKFKFV